MRAWMTEAFVEEGYVVLVADGLDSALDRVRESSPSIDLMIIDVVIPGRSGIELAREIDAMRGGTEVIYMSSHTDEVLSWQSAAAPDATLLRKSFGVDELLEAVAGKLAAERD